MLIAWIMNRKHARPVRALRFRTVLAVLLLGAVLTGGCGLALGLPSLKAPAPAPRWKPRLTLSGVGDHVAWSPDGRLLATNSETFMSGSSSGEECILWDALTGKRLRVLSRNHASVSVAWCPVRQTLAVAAAEGTAYFWDASTNRRTNLSGHRGVHTAAWSRDGRYFATASQDTTPILWDGKSGKKLARLVGHTRCVDDLAWSPSRPLLATASEDQTAMVWQAPTGKRLATLSGHRGAIDRVAWSPDGRTLATGSFDHTARLWKPFGSTPPRVLAGHHSEVIGLDWTPDGTTVATSSADRSGFWRGLVPARFLSPPAETILWQPATGTAQATLGGHPNDIDFIQWSPDGQLLASASYPGRTLLWNRAGRPLGALNGPRQVVCSMKWSPDSRSLACSYFGGQLIIWSR
jgi:WD40 repeat protein